MQSGLQEGRREGRDVVEINKKTIKGKVSKVSKKSRYLLVSPYKLDEI